MPADRVIVANSIPTVTMGDGTLGVQMQGEFTITNAVGTATVTAYDADDVNTTLLAADTDRAGFRIQNTSPSVLYVKFGTTATSASFTVRLPQWGYLEENGYRGQVDGIWAAGASAGKALVTDLTGGTV